MYHRTQGIIIKAFDYKEADQVVTLFAPDMGKVRAVAKGVKKTKSSLRAMVQPFCRSELQLASSGEMYLLTQGRIMDFYGGIREDIHKTLQAVYLVELLDKSTPDRDPNRALFDLTAKTLRHIDENETAPLILRFFEIKLLSLLGYSPQLKHCSSCGEKAALTYFSPSTGGGICEKCAGHGEACKTMPAALAALNTLQQNDLSILSRLKLPVPVMNEMETILEKYLEYYLERRFRTKELIKDMKLFNL